jgi:hypothetical protein
MNFKLVAFLDVSNIEHIWNSGRKIESRLRLRVMPGTELLKCNRLQRENFDDCRIDPQAALCLLHVGAHLRLRRERRADAGMEHFYPDSMEGPPTIKPPALTEDTY